MSTFLYVASSSAILFLSVILTLLFVRAILSLVAPDSDHPFVNLVFNLSDIFLSPARYLFDKTGWFADLPIDMAHLVTSFSVLILMYLFLLLR